MYKFDCLMCDLKDTFLPQPSLPRSFVEYVLLVCFYNTDNLQFVCNSIERLFIRKQLESINQWLIWQQDFHAILSKKGNPQRPMLCPLSEYKHFHMASNRQGWTPSGITCWSIWENAKKGDEADSSTLFFIQAEQSHTCPFFGAANVGNYDDEL